MSEAAPEAGPLRGKLTADSSPYGTRVTVDFPAA